MSLNAIPIFDIDTHYTEPVDLWTSRAPAKYRDKVLNVRRLPDGQDYWFVGDTPVVYIGPGIIDRNNNKVSGRVSLPNMDEMGKSQTDPKERLAVMDSQGIAKAVVYPNVVGFGATRLMAISDDADLRLFHVHAYNDAVALLQKESGGRLLPQAVLPLWDIDLSIKEMIRCREKLGLSGFAMSDKPGDFGQPHLADRAWDKFYAACQDLDWPINFHVGSGNPNDVAAAFWGNPNPQNPDGSMNGPVAAYFSVSLFLANFRDIVNLILSGLFDRYPKLKVVSVESGVGWIPFVMDSLEYSWDEMLPPAQQAQYKLRPTEYFKRHIYASYWFEEPRAVKYFIDTFGADNLMIETDFPHPQALHPNIREKAANTLGGYPESLQRKVLYDTAATLYRI